jgi:hypothetical protein
MLPIPPYWITTTVRNNVSKNYVAMPQLFTYGLGMQKNLNILVVLVVVLLTEALSV